METLNLRLLSVFSNSLFVTLKERKKGRWSTMLSEHNLYVTDCKCCMDVQITKKNDVGYILVSIFFNVNVVFTSNIRKFT